MPNRMRKTHLIAFIDDHSRLVTYGEFFFDEALPRLERVFKVALLRHGVPDAVYVDNGAIFNANQFRAACATLRTEVIYATPYHPQGKGKIEQLWNQIQMSFYPEVATSNITDLETLNQSLWAWLDRIYHVREHGETGQTPFDRFAAGADQIRSVDPETLRRAFQWRATRSVSRQAVIKFQGNTYHVDPAWCGQTIELRFDPFDLSRMDVYLTNGQHLGLAVLGIHKQQYHLDVQRLVPEVLRRNPPAKADSRSLKTLRQEHDLILRKQIGGIRFAALDQSNQNTSTSQE